MVICGGGVAAVEALLALRELLAIRPHIDLIAPDRQFVCQPMAVAEPFGVARARAIDLAEIASELAAELHVDSLASINGAERSVVLASGERLAYDAAIVAVGARRGTWLEGAMHFRGVEDAGAFADVLTRLEQGEVSRLAFAAPAGLSWTLPLYELALLTSSRLAERAVTGVELTILTPEPQPLAIFGAGASGMLRGQLSDRGIRLRAGATARRLVAGRLELSTGETIEAEQVVALPRLEGPRVQGLPADADGFIPVDGHCQVTGLRDVYAAGDGTTFPVKQGGIATQQADVAAESIASRLGAPLQAPVFEPLLRGMLLTGIAPMYMRTGLQAGGTGIGVVAANPLWSPAAKIAGRYLAPYLARAGTLGGRPSLADRPVSSVGSDALEVDRREAGELALVLAESDAHSGDYRSALQWLDVIEGLDGVLPAGCLAKREDWQARLDANRAR